MRIRAGFKLTYDCPSPSPMLLMLSIRPERQPDLETPAFLSVSPNIPVHQFTDSFGNTCSRILAPAGKLVLSSDFIIRDSGQHEPLPIGEAQHAIEDLPDEALQFLMGSRYCQTDLMSDLAWARFGAIEPGWKRVEAIVDYAHERIEFGYQHARCTKSAWDAHEERKGVCRDYAHLAVTLCRAMNIPARYCTGYLGDIGVPPVDAPMDFSAWFEVYLGGKWWTLDARHNTPRIGRILMARGRDATDVAITTTFGAAELVGFEVMTDELAEEKAKAAG
jgi:transglutaminase-like putative cysteine protease